MIDQKEQHRMIELARKIKLKFDKDAKVMVFCNLSSSAPTVWTAKAEKGSKKEETNSGNPLMALEDLLRYLEEREP